MTTFIVTLKDEESSKTEYIYTSLGFLFLLFWCVCPKSFSGDFKQSIEFHNMVFMVCGYFVTACVLIVQHVFLPEDFHWFFRGCIFYVTMVVSFKPIYEFFLEYCETPKIIIPGQTERGRTEGHLCSEYEITKGFFFAMILRGLTFYTARNAFDLSFMESWYRMLVTLLKVLLWTIAYDFFYYGIHRWFHTNMTLFRFIHAKHHSIREPFRGVTLFHTTSEMIFEILFPTFLTQLLLPVVCLSCEELMIAYVNIQILEVLGHCGTAWKISSFVFLPQLPQLLGIDLHIEDHDAHHAERLVNFSKQFSIWDKAFGTYQRGHKAAGARND